MSWTDDPVRDFINHELEKQERLDRYLAGCARCEICQDPIDPDEDPHALQFGDGYLHTHCFKDAVAESDLEDMLKEYVIEAAEEAYLVPTPQPEEE